MNSPLRNLKIVFTAIGVIFLTSASLFSQDKNKKSSDDVSQTISSFEQKGFIENKGQLFDQNHKPNPSCLFLYASDSMNLQLRKTGFSYDVYSITDTAKQKSEEKKLPSNFLFKYHRIDVEIVNINPNVEIEALNPGEEYFNYYNMDNPVNNVKQYSKVLYRNAYKNIDIEFFSNENGKIKYNFIVRPGGKIEDIKLKFDGGNDDFVTYLVNDKIEIQTSLGSLNESIPESKVEGHETWPIIARYIQLAKNTFGFRINESYPSESTLIIDPLTSRSWATYYGGSQHDGSIYGSRFVHDLTLDASGNIYFTASTSSTNQIATTGAFQGTLNSGYDSFVVKFNCDGTRAWGTYYGGPGSDYGHNLATDGSFLYVVGTTNSASDIATTGAYQTVNAGGTEDLFLIKFDFNGNRIWGTYYGGANWDYGADIAISPSGEIYIAGGTNSTNGISTVGSHQPSFGGVWDTFIAKFTTAGTRVWGTYYGGAPTEAWWSTRIATDIAGNVYVAADVWADNPAIASVGAHQPVYGGGSSDAFLAKFNSSGTRLWGTFYGGSGNETYGTSEPFGIKTDASQNVYFFGTTGSANNISTTGCYQPALQGGNDVFLAKFDSTGLRQWGTYYGGPADESGYGITLDFAGGIYVSGLTASSSGIATSGAYSSGYNGGGSDGFFSKFSNNGFLQSGSYYGGSGTDRVNCIVTDGVTQLYLFGETDSPSNISTPGSFQPAFGGGAADAFLVKFLDIDNIQIIGPDSVCVDSSYTYTTAIANSSSVSYNWIFPTGTTITSGQGTNTVNIIWGVSYAPIIVQVTYPGLCTSINDTLPVTSYCACLTGLQLTSLQTNDSCNMGSSGIATVNVTGGASPFNCIWSPVPAGGQGTQTATGLNAGIYGIKVSDANGCFDSTFVLINIHPLVVVAAGPDTSICEGNSVNLTATGTVNYVWTPATDLNTTIGSLVISTPSISTTYYVTGTDSSGCSNSDSVKVSVNPKPLVSFTAQAVCLGDTTVFTNTSTSVGGFSSVWLFGYNSDSATSTNTSFFYPLCNNYLVSLIVTSDSGCVAALTDTAFVDCKPSAAFTVNNVCTNEVAVFINTSTGASSNSWDFDYNTGIDNTTQSPTHFYAAGNYNIQLIAGSVNGCKDTIFHNLIVFPKPVANFVSDSVCLGDNSTFAGSSAVLSDTIISWEWNFGDNSPLGATQNPVHTYSNAGTQNVSLIITSNNGCNDTITQNAVVHTLPDALFSAGNACTGSNIPFTDFSTIPSGGAIQSWAWDFDNGGVINTNQNPSNSFITSGSYFVQLIIVSNFGCKDSITKEITVNPNPIVNFSSIDTIGCSPLCITFQNSSFISSGSIISSLWDFGDGSIASDPNHCYLNNSDSLISHFNVSLTVTSDSGCVTVGTKNNYIAVYPTPNADFSVQPQTTTITDPIISITDLSTGANFWNWNFGDGSAPLSTSLQIPYAYSDTGTYIITLIISNQYNCIDTAYQTIIIEPDFVFFIPNSFSPNGDGINDNFTGKGVFIKIFEMSIFDRWGNLIFFTNNIDKAWDGKANHGSETAQEDVYVYSIKITDTKRIKHNYKGIVTLVK